MIARFKGHIAHYLGDGLLVYFGYPLAHEDDAEWAVRATRTTQRWDSLIENHSSVMPCSVRNILWHAESSRSGYTQPMICLA